MLPYSVTIKGDTDKVVAAQNQNIRNSPNQMANAMKRNVGRLKSRMLKVRRKEPPPASSAYKLPWTNKDQRIAVIIKLRKAGNLPYKRTHDLRDGWDLKAKADANGGSVTVENDAPEAEFVYGARRQPMFDKIGWLDAQAQDAKDAAELQEVVAQTWFTIADETAGVK